MERQTIHVKYQIRTFSPCVIREDLSGFILDRKLARTRDMRYHPHIASFSYSTFTNPVRCHYTIAMVLTSVVLFLLLTLILFLRISSLNVHEQGDPEEDNTRWEHVEFGELHLPRNDPLAGYRNIHKRAVLTGQSAEGLDTAEGQGRADTCQTGHIDGLDAKCDSNGCLPKLHANESASRDRSHFEANLVGSRLKDLLLLPALTAVQFRESIFGSIGIVTVDDDDLEISEYVSLQADISSGERIFRSVQHSAAKSPCSYDGCSAAESMTVNGDVITYYGKMVELSKEFFIRAALPQFRLIYVSDQADVTSLQMTLEHATCLLRDGGLIIVRCGRNKLSRFFQTFARFAISPLIVTKNIYILCTRNFKRVYLQRILEDRNLSNKFSFVKEYNNKFGVKDHYLLVR